MDMQLINPSQLYDGATAGMSQAVADPASRLVFISGQVDWDRESRVRHTSLDGQAEGAIQNLLLALAAAGSSAAQVLQLHV